VGVPPLRNFDHPLYTVQAAHKLALSARKNGAIMRRIIEGKAYNTDTAERLAEFESGVGRSKELYRTQKGAYFLARWTDWDGEECRITVIDAAAARKVLEECNAAEATEALEKYFDFIEA